MTPLLPIWNYYKFPSSSTLCFSDWCLLFYCISCLILWVVWIRFFWLQFSDVHFYIVSLFTSFLFPWYLIKYILLASFSQRLGPSRDLQCNWWTLVSCIIYFIISVYFRIHPSILLFLLLFNLSHCPYNFSSDWRGFKDRIETFQYK